MSTRLVIEDFLERNRCRIFVKTSEYDDFLPSWDSLQVVGCATPADPNSTVPNASKHSSKYYIQFTVQRRMDYRRCLGDLFDMSLRKEKGWLLLWVVTVDRRFLARLDADKAIIQGALMHRTFWFTVREDLRIRQKRGAEAVPDFRSLQLAMTPLLHCMPDRMVTVSLMWVQKGGLGAAAASYNSSASVDQDTEED